MHMHVGIKKGIGNRGDEVDVEYIYIYIYIYGCAVISGKRMYPYMNSYIHSYMHTNSYVYKETKEGDLVG